MHLDSTLTCTETAPDDNRGDVLVESNIAVLEQLSGGIGEMDAQAYTRQVDAQTSSIGMHVRHVIEFYQEFLKTVNSKGEKGLCYDNRERNMLFETSKDIALEELENIGRDFVSLSLHDDDIALSITIDPAQPFHVVRTNMYRELYHLFDHATHHMAIIKMIAAKQDVVFDANFGVACATQRHKRSLT